MMSSFKENIGTDAGIQQTGRGVEPQAELDPRLLRVCCGHPIAPRLAEIRRPGGRILFVTVWQCPICNRVTS